MAAANKVLVIDDSKTMRDFMKNVLSSNEAEILEAEDGIRGLEMLMKHRGEICLVFCDINMPNMDGLTMVKRHASNVKDGFPNIPIIMLTTESSKEQVLLAKRAGVAGWIIKPPQEETIQSIYQRFSKKKAS